MQHIHREHEESVMKKGYDEKYHNDYVKKTLLQSQHMKQKL